MQVIEIDSDSDDSVAVVDEIRHRRDPVDDSVIILEKYVKFQFFPCLNSNFNAY